MSRTSWWHQDLREQEEAAAAAVGAGGGGGLDQPPLAKRKHKPHKVHEYKNVARTCVVSAKWIYKLYLLIEYNFSGDWAY